MAEMSSCGSNMNANLIKTKPTVSGGELDNIQLKIYSN